MGSGAWMMVVVGMITVGILVFLGVTIVRGIVVERARERGIWREFGLGGQPARPSRMVDTAARRLGGAPDHHLRASG